jgi:hypothetical protein
MPPSMTCLDRGAMCYADLGGNRRSLRCVRAALGFVTADPGRIATELRSELAEFDSADRDAGVRCDQRTPEIGLDHNGVRSEVADEEVRYRAIRRGKGPTEPRTVPKLDEW